MRPGRRHFDQPSLQFTPGGLGEMIVDQKETVG
jgi:hypothetical protein